MPEQTPLLESIISAIHAVLAEPGVRCRPTQEGEHVIEFTETALVAFLADQRAAVWEAARAGAAPSPDLSGDTEALTAIEQAVVDLLDHGPRTRGEIDQAVMAEQGCARATVSRALDALTQRAVVVPLPGRKGWHLSHRHEHSAAAAAILQTLSTQGPATTTMLRQALKGWPGCGETSVDQALKALLEGGEIAKTHNSRKAPWSVVHVSSTTT